MTNYPIDGVLADTESVIEIDLVNKPSGATYSRAAVNLENCLYQILKEYAKDIGINPEESKIIFENKRTGESTSDSNETVRGLDLREGDVLAISDNCSVAAVVSDGEHPFSISLYNKATGACFSKVDVLADNTLAQVVHEYGDDIGVNPHAKRIHFENKQTGIYTCSGNETIGELGLKEGDVLTITVLSYVA